ncbi:MAG: hypothetical protein J5809_05310 [Selenomonadaceae bacterium]|nr:hypothetical protein [Selenomonadaceae bacterium]
MQSIKFSVRTLSPVVMSSGSNTTIMTGTHSAFSGSIIRGVLAARYVEAQKLSDAFRDETFREIFYGSLNFLPANPEISGARSIVLPLSLQKAKAGTSNENEIQDLLIEEKPGRGYKSLRGYGTVAGGEIQTASVGKNIFMHMSRSGEAERIAGKSIEGQIYNYEALDAGQIFQGEIIGDAETLKKLRAGLKLDGNTLTAYVGRSRFTQYGKCRFTFDKPKEILAQDFAEKIYLRLETPLIPAADTFLSAEQILQAEVVEVLAGKFKLGKIFSAEVEVENFVVPWGMKRPRVKALAAGTVFELSAKEKLTAADKKILSDKLYSGVGIRTEEGFGQLRLWDSKSFTLVKAAAGEVSDREKFSDETKKLAKKILRERLLAQIRIYAIEDAQKLELPSGNLTHFFSRLDAMLSNSKTREIFQQQVKDGAKDGSLFSDHLKNLRLTNGQSLYDALTGQAKLPYENKDLNLGGELQNLFGDLRKEFDVEFYFEYLRSYLRFARKQAAKKGGDDE